MMMTIFTRLRRDSSLHRHIKLCVCGCVVRVTMMSGGVNLNDAFIIRGSCQRGYFRGVTKRNDHRKNLLRKEGLDGERNEGRKKENEASTSFYFFFYVTSGSCSILRISIPPKSITKSINVIIMNCLMAFVTKKLLFVLFKNFMLHNMCSK